MKKLIALLISITFLTLPACNKRNIEQITGTITTTTEQPKEAVNIVPDEKAAKEEINKHWGFNEYIETAKSCCKWTWRNKEYIAGGTVAVVAIGLIVWGARGDPAPKAKTVHDGLNQPHNDNDLPGGKPAAEKKQTSQEMNAYGNTIIRDYSTSDDDVFQATEAEMQSLSREPPILQAQGNKITTHKAYGLTEDSEHFISYKFSKTKAQNPKPADRIFLNGEKSKGIYMFAPDGHWYNIVFNGHTPKPFKPVVIDTPPTPNDEENE